MFGLQVVCCHHVQFPAVITTMLFQQLGSQTYVLTITANRLCQVAGFNGDIHGAFIFINHDGGNICRSHGVDNELRRIVIPKDDIDTFAAQFTGNGLNACTAHTDTSTDRVDALVVGFHCDFCTGARITGCRFNLDQLFTDFWHFNAEQFDQHFVARTADKQLCATCFRTNIIQNATNTVARAEVFTRKHIFTQDHSFSIAA